MNELKPIPVGTESPVESPARTGVLPYSDSKMVGAADFYFAINATFRFIEMKCGREGLRQYWQDLGRRYYAPLTASWKRVGLPAVAAYWRAFFAAEPGGEVQVDLSSESVTLDVCVCPAIQHLRAHAREIVPCFCQHCYYVSEAAAAPAGLAVRVEGGNGTCRQTFVRRTPELPPQDLARIREAA